jgi:hypothetical protein
VDLDDLADASWLGVNPEGNLGLSIASADANNDGFDDLFFNGIPPEAPDYSERSAWFWYGQGI